MSTPSPQVQSQLLYRLHQIDVGLAEGEERLRHLDPGDGHDEAVHTADQQHAQAARDLSDRQARIRTLELELQSAVAKRKRVEEEMYSGRVRNPKELAAMQDELGQLDRQTGHLEEDILTLMEEAEGLMARVPALALQVEEARARLAAHEEYLRRTREEVEELRAAFSRERESLTRAIDPDLLRRYERIRERSGGTAVAAVQGGICEGCRMAIPEGRVRRLAEEPEAIITCERCGRILVMAGR